MDSSYAIVLADHHVRFRRELRKVLEELPGVEVIGEAGDRQELFELLRHSSPEMVILDMAIPGLRAGEGARLIKERYPQIKVLTMVMDHEREYLNHELAAGAAGVLPKQYVGGEISRAITQVRQGKIYISSQTQPQKAGWTETAASRV